MMTWVFSGASLSQVILVIAPSQLMGIESGGEVYTPLKLIRDIHLAISISPSLDFSKWTIEGGRAAFLPFSDFITVPYGVIVIGGRPID